MKSENFLLLAGLLLFFYYVDFAGAAVLVGDSHQLNLTVVPSGSEKLVGVSHNLSVTFSQPVVGVTEGSSHLLRWGFLYTIVGNVTAPAAPPPVPAAGVLAPTITNVRNTSIGADSVTIAWDTDVGSNSSVNYTNTTDAFSTGLNDNVTSHSVAISDLQNGTLHFYNVTSCNTNGTFVNCSTNSSAAPGLFNYNFTTLPLAVPSVVGVIVRSLADLYDYVFVLQLLIAAGLFLLKLYNLMTGATFYDLRMAVLTFVIFVANFGIGFVTTLQTWGLTFYFTIMQLETWLFLLVVAIFVGELFLYLGVSAKKYVKPSKAYLAKSR